MTNIKEGQVIQWLLGIIAFFATIGTGIVVTFTNDVKSELKQFNSNLVEISNMQAVVKYELGDHEKRLGKLEGGK